MQLEDYEKGIPVCFSDDSYPQLPKFPQVETPSFRVVNDFSSGQKFCRPNYYIRSIPDSSPYTSYVLSNSDLEFYDEVLPDIPLSLFDKSIEKWEKSSDTKPAINKKQALSNCKFKNTAGIEAIYTYWTTKRKKRKTPLIRSFWKSVETTDPNLSNVFCRRKNEKMRLRNVKARESESKQKTLKLFCQISELKDLVIWVLRRESLKLNIVKLKTMEFEHKRADLLSQRYYAKDFEEVLREPVLENSLRFRNPISYLNIYQKTHPRVNLRS